MRISVWPFCDGFEFMFKNENGRDGKKEGLKEMRAKKKWENVKIAFRISQNFQQNEKLNLFKLTKIIKRKEKMKRQTNIEF